MPRPAFIEDPGPPRTVQTADGRKAVAGGPAPKKDATKGEGEAS